MPILKQDAAKKKPAPGDRKGAANPVRPVSDPIDYTAMRQDLIAAFPKTLDRLAE